MPNWTNEQQNAIDYRDCNLLVAAAAGSGKTAVLVERIIKRITDSTNPWDIDRLLVVTFTNAAASEMRERISEALLIQLELNPLDKNLQKQYVLLGKANIMTIHSFCLKIIKENYHLLDIDPDFTVADPTEADILLIEAVNQAFSEFYLNPNPDPGFISFVKSYGDKSGDSIKNLAIRIYKSIQSNPWPEQWLKDNAERFNDTNEFETTLWGRAIIEDAKEQLEYSLFMIEDALSKLAESSELDKYINTFIEDSNSIAKLLNNLNSKWDDIIKSMQNIEFTRLPPIRNVQDKEFQEDIKNTRDEVKKIVKKLNSSVFCLSQNNYIQDNSQLYKLFRSFGQFIIRFKENFVDLKKQKQLLDFNDFEHLALSLLLDNREDGNVKTTSLAKEYQKQFEEVLIDEYQDSNLVQEYILNAVSKIDEKKNIFMVGDVKQSIYGFRHAMPDLFLSKYEKYSSTNLNDERKITLYRNFRSRKEVLDAVNYIFKRIMSKNLGDIHYDDSETLNLGADYPIWPEDSAVPAVDVVLIDLDAEIVEETPNDNSELEERPITAKLEARSIIENINMMMDESSDFMVTDKTSKMLRKSKYSDFVILMRSPSGWANIFEEEFNSAGLPVFTDVGSGLFSTIEISAIFSLMKTINNPFEDIYLMSLMRSPFFSFNNNDLADIRIVNRKDRFYEAVEKAVHDDTLDLQLKSKLKYFVDLLNKWRALSKLIPVSELIWQITEETGFMTYIYALPDGIKRETNIKLLFEYIRGFERSGINGLISMITYIENVIGNSTDFSEAKLVGEEDNVIRIMSVHKSKGLEFPVVFLAGLGKKFNKKDLNDKVIMHMKYGYGPDVMDIKRNIYHQSLPKIALKSIMDRENLSEEMRVLYVAATRAKEKLILISSQRNLESFMNKAIRRGSITKDKLSPSIVRQGSCFMEWIISAFSSNVNFMVQVNQYYDIQSKGEIDYSNDLNVKLYIKNAVDFLENVVIEECKDYDLILKDWLLEKDLDLYNDIDESLQWKYLYENYISIPAKLTVTELKKLEESGIIEDGSDQLFKPSKSELPEPVFLSNNRKLSSSEVGTAYHKVFSMLDFKKKYQKEDINELLDKLKNNQILSHEEFSAINPNKVLSFTYSNFWTRAFESKSIYKEKTFIFKAKVKEKVESVVQGVIDMYFIDSDNQIILLDYKTDREVKDESLETYKTQLNYYTQALEQLTGLKVKEKILYFINLEIFMTIN